MAPCADGSWCSDDRSAEHASAQDHAHCGERSLSTSPDAGLAVNLRRYTPAIQHAGADCALEVAPVGMRTSESFSASLAVCGDPATVRTLVQVPQGRGKHAPEPLCRLLETPRAPTLLQFAQLALLCVDNEVLAYRQCGSCHGTLTPRGPSSRNPRAIFLQPFAAHGRVRWAH